MSHKWGNTSRHERGYGAAWERIRLTIIARDNALCQSCKRQGRITPCHAVDHIKPKAQGGTDDPANLECICRDCHATKTATESAQAQGRTVKQRAAFTDGGRVVWPD